MHKGIQDYVRKHKDKLIGRVLEVGSFNFNGCISDIVPDMVKTDMIKGPNVDILCPAEKLLEYFGPESFDSVVTCDAFEHIEDWRGCVRNMWAVLKTGGWLVMTMAAPGKGRHNYPDDYWRCNWEHVIQIFHDAEEMESFGPSMGWIVKKNRDLPNLDEIHLIKVP